MARQLGVSAATVSSRLADAGIVADRGGHNCYSDAQSEQRRQRAFHAVALQSSGLSRARIADRLELSLATVKTLLSSARFLADPQAYPSRYAMAVRAHLDGWTRKSVRGQAEERARTDARDLLATNSEAFALDVHPNATKGGSPS